MTFEEFKKMAQTKPEIKCQSIFKVEIFFISMWDVDKNGEEVAPYRISRIIDLDSPEIYYFHNYEQAKTLIFSKKEDYPKAFYCGRIIELPLNLKIQESEHLSITVFDKNANTSYYSYYSIIEKGMSMLDRTIRGVGYNGCPEEEMPFKKGEIVEVLDYENAAVRLGVILKTPKSLEAIWEENPETIMMERDMNSYRVMTGKDDVEYIDAEYVSKPSFPVSNELKERYQRWFESDSTGRNAEGTDFASLLQLL